MARAARLGTIAMVASLAFVTPAWGTLCGKLPLADSFVAAEHVFVGQARGHTLWSIVRPGWVEYRFNVRSVQKGVVHRRQVVGTHLNTSASKPSFVRGYTYQVFARDGEDGVSYMTSCDQHPLLLDGERGYREARPATGARMASGLPPRATETGVATLAVGGAVYGLARWRRRAS